MAEELFYVGWVTTVVRSGYGSLGGGTGDIADYAAVAVVAVLVHACGMAAVPVHVVPVVTFFPRRIRDSVTTPWCSAVVAAAVGVIGVSVVTLFAKPWLMDAITADFKEAELVAAVSAL